MRKGGQIKRVSIDYLQKQHEANPLVVSVLFPLSVGIRLGVVDAGERHLQAFALPVGCGDSVGAVYPAVCVENVLGQVLAVYAVDRVADVLAGGDDQGERDQYNHREAVVQSKDSAVGVDVRDFNEALETTEYVQHFGTERHRGREKDRAVTAPGDGGDSSGWPPGSVRFLPRRVIYIFRCRFRSTSFRSR